MLGLNRRCDAFPVDTSELVSFEDTIPDRQSFEAGIRMTDCRAVGVDPKRSTTPVRKAIPPGDVSMEA